ncbi:hypothetical protein [Zhongshania aliphaticivorans]|uniref:Uncharacterized protein n=1 Tax=Zhongshania aliphaticivorans TaxID=1470434 RepID=A0A127M207_9GAMM|nr:hypothetical protein [Zhongshania aliphaticivorans]AMO67265.1 hypothetical protein AZF00_02660 [Zhongshania aliphaticivorans]
MNTLTKETARSLAKVINSRLSTCYNDDLVAILGTGRESNNEQAVQSWLISRFAHIEVGRTDMLMEYASDVLTQHLDDIRLEVAIGVITEPLQPSFIPAKALTDREIRCIARGIYLLVLGQGSRDYLDALVDLALDGQGNAIERIAAWTSIQTQIYTYFPSELTLPLAQRLMQKFKDAN